MADGSQEHNAPDSTASSNDEQLRQPGENGTGNGLPYSTLQPITETPAVYGQSSDPYGSEPPVPSGAPALEPEVVTSSSVPAPVLQKAAPPAPPAPPRRPADDDDDDDPEEEGMLRMSFMEHLEELRSRILKALIGLVVAFLFSIIFCKEIWAVVEAPAVQALKNLGFAPKLAAIQPMEQFNVIYFKLPLLVSVFLGSPWILYQVWAFIAPGLYKREKRWAVPFIASTAGLFIGGGLFAYFVAFRFGLEFLLGIGRDVNVLPVVSINEYFDLFVNVTLGIGLVFEMPVIIFFLTLLRLASPRFLLKHSRYAILAIVVIAAIVTPTPDIFNLMLFAIPMVLLYFIGLFASYLLVLRREEKAFPWRTTFLVLLGIVIVAAAVLAIFVFRYHYHFISKSPYLVR
jgi:sec-independent protein translocase protein TatC